jgi:hypothetical protein
MPLIRRHFLHDRLYREEIKEISENRIDAEPKIEEIKPI